MFDICVVGWGFPHPEWDAEPHMLAWSRRDGERYPRPQLKTEGERFRVKDEDTSLPLFGVVQLIFAKPHLHVCLCVCVYVCVGAWSCVRACMSEKEGALAPESALWGDHSCTLPAANWSLSSCPIHLHFLPITEHYLCSQLGMGLNPFWLSWCYSLQISNGDGEGRAGGDETEGKGVREKGAGGTSCCEDKVQKLPIVPLQREALSARWRHRKENNYGRNQLLAL